MKFSSVLASALSVAAAAAANSTIEIKGNKWFYSNNGTEFYVKGIAYQQDVTNSTSSDNTFTDPLSDLAGCKRDLPYLLDLGTNVLRVYAINTTQSHDDCMNLFYENGIYVMCDLSEPGLSINRDSPAWDVNLYSRYTEVVDTMAAYENVIGFFAGNEVTNNASNTDASPFVKAAVRDIKAYIADKDYRSIPVGYATNDDADTRDLLAQYFLCGDSSDVVDFYGINMYEWCGDSSFSSSGYEARTKEFSNLTIPLIMSEYGCNAVQPRTFTEVAALYSDDMTGVWSGGIVYMYFQETNDYGLVSVSGSSVSTLADFSYLSKQMASISPSSVLMSAQSASSTSIACPASTLNYWKASDELPPTPEKGTCECMSNAMNCVVASSVSSDDYGDLFGNLCGVVDCTGITANGTSGTYGAYSFCDDEQKLNFVLNLYYEKNGAKSSACNWSGSASLNTAASTPSSCSAVLSQAGSSGLGSITAGITSGTGSASQKASGSSDASGSSGSSSASSSSSKAGAPQVALSSGMSWLAAVLSGSVFALTLL